MRELVYVMDNGMETKSYDEVVRSQRSYKVEMREVRSERSKLSPIRQAMLEQFGYVSASLRDKVVL